MTLEEEASRLRAENAELRSVVAHLQEQLTAALVRIGELEPQWRSYPPPFVKLDMPKHTNPRRPREKRERHHNHPRRHEVPTRTFEHALYRCPDCHYLLRGNSIELPPSPLIENIEHRVVKGFCSKCARWRRPQIDLNAQVFGRSRIGVHLASFWCICVRRCAFQLQSCGTTWLMCISSP